MTREEMNRLIEEHLAAEQASDPDRSVAMYSDDVIHDLVGSPLGPLQGPRRQGGSTSSSRRTSRPSRWTSTTRNTGRTSA